MTLTLAGQTYRSTVAVYGDEFFLPLNAANRAAAGVEAGDEVEVTLDVDHAPREVVILWSVDDTELASLVVEAGAVVAQAQAVLLGRSARRTAGTRCSAMARRAARCGFSIGAGSRRRRPVVRQDGPWPPRWPANRRPWPARAWAMRR